MSLWGLTRVNADDGWATWSGEWAIDRGEIKIVFTGQNVKYKCDLPLKRIETISKSRYIKGV
ncbi:hypothetical protein LZY01_22100 [Levilactobacillus zymae]|uniref:Uncharacterized protein n=1 Tax=Levilactobacillus zymae TaxID=267363 RepID=A0ABQ0X3Q7_9LACO|nr:hypothetical protein LZY01_22100 [Levilactobacillus zymae]